MTIALALAHSSRGSTTAMKASGDDAPSIEAPSTEAPAAGNHHDANMSPPPEQQPSRTAAAAAADEHDTLKYHLLGPSLTKAGQDSVDQQKVSEIIYNASKGSKFFNNEEVKDRVLTDKIAKILAKKRQLDKVDLRSELRRADDYLAELELGRDLSQVVIHIDCDAFYAAVEELDRPELRDVPMAVGKGVLTTCNYHARKFGCRSGMAGFVAMKLCPQLICVPMNFAKYSAKAEEVRAVLARYDPRFESASCDEAYLNLTSYCEEHNMEPEEAVSQLRAEVHEKTKITVSAGIAANAKLAKICSNKNKPNGQFYLARDRQTIMDFMKTLPTRKVNGIGRVFERELDAVGIKTCGDIYAQRAYLSSLFGQKAFQFLMQCYLGLGRTQIQPAEDYERKSVGTETTFRELSSPDSLRQKLRDIAEELEGDLKRTEYKGRTLCIKIKLHTYEVYTRQMTPPFAIQRADDLYKYSLPMLEKLIKEMPSLKLRLMGLRVTHIVSTKKPGIDFFGRQRAPLKTAPTIDTNATTKPNLKTQDQEQDPNPDTEFEFEAAAAQERNNEMNELEQLSQEYERQSLASAPTLPPNQNQNPNPNPDPFPISKPSPSQEEEEEEEEEVVAVEKEPPWTCPICALPQPPDDASFNAHIDFCLSRQTIRDAVKETAPLQESRGVAVRDVSRARGRGRGKGKGVERGKRGRVGDEDEKGREKRRAFFGVG